MTNAFSLIKLQTDEQEPADADELFASVHRKPNLADDVIRQIERAIIDMRLKPGDRLPPERELGRQFSVSRTVVREAVHALIARNLLEIQPGTGTVVSQPSTQTISDSIRLLLHIGRPHVDVRELAEVRQHLELLTAGLSAQRRTADDLQELSDLIEQMAESDTVDRFVRYDMAFHLALAEATQNRLYAVLLSSIIDIVVDISVVASARPVTRERATNHHRRIFEFVKQGDVEGARHAMRDHLVTFEDTARQVAESRSSQG